MNTADSFVIVGLQPWYTSIGSNCKNIALALAKTHRVIYINSPLDYRTVLQKKSNTGIARHLDIIHKKQNPVIKIQENLWMYYPQNILISANWLPSTGMFSAVNYYNNLRFADDIRKATQTLGFKNYVLFNDNEIFRAMYLKQLLKPELYIYYCRDYLTAVDYWKKHGQKLEPLHIKKADIALANSEYLCDYLTVHNPNSSYIGQGCDTGLFDGKKNYQLPADLAAFKKPLIGYVGALSGMRLDIPCLLNIARQKQEWQLVLVGPEDDEFERSGLHQLPNVHFLGAKPLNELPAYIAGFDVCINPQLVNPLTIGNYPLKVDEYLNMGKPVVATSTKAMTMFEPYTYLATGADDYIPLIEKALSERADHALKQQRIAFACNHTWDNSVKLLHMAIDNTRSIAKPESLNTAE